MKKFQKMIVIALVIFSSLAVIGLTRLVAVRAATATAVPLGSILTNNFVILTETGITNAGHGSTIVGNVGNSPGTAAQMSNVYCSEITGTIYGVDANAAYVGNGNTSCFAGNPGVPPVSPSDANKTLVDNAKNDMVTAYGSAAGQGPGTGDFLNVGAGTLSGQVLAPGVYTWNTPVTITGDITLLGGANDVWVFQTSGTLDIQVGKKIILSGGAQAKNIFWQVAGVVSLLGTSHFEGTILAQTKIAMEAGATLTGRALAQTEVTLIGNTISGPTALHLRKIVTNDNGGLATSTDWILTANGATSSPTNLASTTPVNSDSTFKADTYTLGENSGPSGYASSTYSCINNGITTVSNTIILAAGDDATCTITNNDIAPILHLRKTMINDNGGTALNTAWTLTATGATSSPTNLASTTPVDSDSTFKADTYTLGENSGPSGYDSSTYSCVINGAAAVVSNTIVLAAGDNATCTITNNDIAPTPSGGGGITVNNPACTDVTYSPVYSAACFGGYQYREVVSRTPAGCSVTAAQTEASKRVCAVNAIVYPVATTTVETITPTATTSTPLLITPLSKFVPKLPNTGISPAEGNAPWNLLIFTGVFLLISTSLIFVIKKRTN